MKILTDDDHALVREGLQVILKRALPDAEFAEAASGGELFQVLGRHPDVELVLLDVQLPDTSGLDLLERLRQQQPHLPVVMLSAEHDPAMVADSINRGASGFVSKASLGQVLVSAIQLVLAGGIYLPPEMLRAASAGARSPSLPTAGLSVALAAHASPQAASQASPGAPSAATSAAASAAPTATLTGPAVLSSPRSAASGPEVTWTSPVLPNGAAASLVAPAGTISPDAFGLTDRQLDVLWLLLEGCSNKQICRELGLAEPTVKIHVRAILRALDVASRTEVVVVASRMGWSRPQPSGTLSS